MESNRDVSMDAKPLPERSVSITLWHRDTVTCMCVKFKLAPCPLRLGPTSCFSVFGNSSIWVPTAKNDALMPAAVNVVSKVLELGLGPSSKVSAYMLASTHLDTGPVGWQGPQSAGQLPQVCQAGEGGRGRVGREERGLAKVK